MSQVLSSIKEYEFTVEIWKSSSPVFLPSPPQYFILYNYFILLCDEEKLRERWGLKL